MKVTIRIIIHIAINPHVSKHRLIRFMTASDGHGALMPRQQPKIAATSPMMAVTRPEKRPAGPVRGRRGGEDVVASFPNICEAKK